MLKIAVFGANGRMGRAVTRVVSASADPLLVAVVRHTSAASVNAHPTLDVTFRRARHTQRVRIELS